MHELDQSASVEVGGRLADKLIGFDQTLTDVERFNMKLLMSVAVGGIAPRGGVPTEGVRLDAWKAGLRVLGAMQPSGLVSVGRAPFLTADLLEKLRAEAAEQEKVAHRTGPQELAPGGARAVALSKAPEVLDYVGKRLGQAVVPTEIGSYMYYNRPGDHLYPHVDTEIFSVNLITMIEHLTPHGVPIGDASALLIYEPDGQLRRILLEPGESTIILASGTVHGREPIAPDERVVILTVGFQLASV
jgi:hypothetical protein